MLVMGRGPTGARRALGHTWRADLLGRRPWPRPEPREPREVSEKGAPEPSGQSSRGGCVRRLVLGGATSLQKQPEPGGRGRRRGPVPAPHSTRAVLCWGSGPMQGLRCQTGLGSPPCSGPGRGLQTSAGDRQLPHPRGGRHQAKDSAQACTLPWEPTAGAQLGLMDVHRALPPSHAHTRAHAHAPGEQSGPSPDWACRSGGCLQGGCLQEAPAWPWGEAAGAVGGREAGAGVAVRALLR